MTEHTSNNTPLISLEVAKTVYLEKPRTKTNKTIAAVSGVSAVILIFLFLPTEPFGTYTGEPILDVFKFWPLLLISVVVSLVSLAKSDGKPVTKSGTLEMDEYEFITTFENKVEKYDTADINYIMLTGKKELYFNARNRGENLMLPEGKEIPLLINLLHRLNHNNDMMKVEFKEQ